MKKTRNTRKEATTMATTGTIHQVPAPSQGGLPGFSYTCPKCGLEITYSLETMVVSDAQAHKAWHEGRTR
jgi:hypothetical protein